MTTARTRRALLVTSDDEPVTTIEEQLTAAGYDVRRCIEGGTSFPCVGIAGGTCPLDLEGGLDVAIDVRQHPWPHPTLREAGVTCALRAGVPLVVFARPGHPFEELATLTAHGANNVADRCERAIDLALQPIRDAVAAEVRAVFANHDADSPFAVHVDRRRGRLHVRITTGAPSGVRAMAATRAAVAIRRLDRATSIMEIEVVDPA